MLVLLFLLSVDVTSLLDHDVVAGERICQAAALRTFYARRHGSTAWDDASTTELLSALARLLEDGIEPRRYHTAALTNSTAATERDVLATDAFLTAATHLSQGVVDPQFARPTWCAPPSRLDLAAVLQAALDDHTVGATLGALVPRHEEYARLRKALAAYREVALHGGWHQVPDGPALRRGSDDARVVDVRKRLAAAGSERKFDGDLDALVRHFQGHHAIAVDGVVGPETLHEMNVPASERVQQIAVAMERWRWMPEDPGESYVIVNIAAFRLDVIEGGRSVLSMKTVVGKDYNRTPFFAARINEVIVNPWWNVPDSIAAKELWPKRRRDPSYFAREHMVVTNGRIRQRPGPWNALGRLKFNMANRYNVYLHDTPSQHLFARPFRAFSHGCIRLERPMDLALYLLRDQPQWTASSLYDAIDAASERAIRLTSPQPVYVLYWTAWVGDDGHVEFSRDHYQRDSAIAAALQ